MKNIQPLTNSFKNTSNDRYGMLKNFSLKKKNENSHYDQRILLTMASTSILLTKQSVAAYDEKSVQNTEKLLTENINLSKITEDNFLVNISDTIKIKVQKIFNNFAKYSNEELDFILSQQALIKILRYMNILNDKDIKLCDIDVILKKVCIRATKLNQEQFLDFVAQLSFKLDPMNFTSNPKETILNIVQVFFDPFIEFLEQQNFSVDDLNNSNSLQLVQLSIPNFIEKFEIDQRMITLISSIYSGIKEVYQLYFHYENNDYILYEQILKQSLNSYIEFCKHYEIYPYLLNMNQIVCYWNYVNCTNNPNKKITIFEGKKDLGKVFTLNKFAVMLIHFSVMTFSKINNASQNLAEFGKPYLI